MDEGGSVSFRRITAICYLRGSENPWKASDGGALRLYPPAITTSTNELDEGSSDSRVVIKFASQLGLLDSQQQQQQQQRGTPASAVCGGGVTEDNGQDSENNNTLSGGGAGTGEWDGGDDGPGVSGGRCVRDADGGDNGGDGTRGGQEGVASFLDVAPLAGRAVVFFSGAVEHEVLPVTGPSPRAALTTWFH